MNFRLNYISIHKRSTAVRPSSMTYVRERFCMLAYVCVCVLWQYHRVYSVRRWTHVTNSQTISMLRSRNFSWVYFETYFLSVPVAPLSYTTVIHHPIPDGIVASYLFIYFKNWLSGMIANFIPNTTFIRLSQYD